MSPFHRFLLAKRSVDDRALNKSVWRIFQDRFQAMPYREPVRCLELGAGIGTMIDRLQGAGMFERMHYTALDADPAIADAARSRFAGEPLARNVEILTADALDFAAKSPPGSWDVLLAHAFLDLVDLDEALPRFLRLLRPGGIFYFTLNFDGVTVFEPVFDAELDAHIMALYHGTMGDRDYRAAGDSLTGRRLFGHLQRNGAHIVAAGASDWVVFAGADGYGADEAYFLAHILGIVETALTGHPDLPADDLAKWLAIRRRQLDAHSLVYIAHQLDFFGTL